MMNQNKWETGTKIIKIVLAALAVYLGMKYLFPIVLPFFIAFVFARLLHPLAEKIQRSTGLKKTMACALTYLIFLLLLGCIAVGIFYFCYKMGSSCMQNMGNMAEQARDFWCLCCERIEGLTGVSMDVLQKKFAVGNGTFAQGAVEYSKEAGKWAIGFFATMLVSFVATLLILNDYGKIRDGLFKSRVGLRIGKVARDLKKAVWEYLKAQFLIWAIVTVICIVGLLLMKNPYALLAGIAIGFSDALPFLGTGVVFVPWALIDVLMGDYVAAVIHLVIYLVCTFTRQILEPKLVGTKLGVHPLAVLMSIYIGIRIYGGIGVVFGPVSALIIWEIWKYINEEELL